MTATDNKNQIIKRTGVVKTGFMAISIWCCTLLPPAAADNGDSPSHLTVSSLGALTADCFESPMAQSKGDEESLKRKRRQMRDALLNQVLGMIWKKYQPKSLVAAGTTDPAHKGPKIGAKLSSKRVMISVKYRF